MSLAIRQRVSMMAETLHFMNHFLSSLSLHLSATPLAISPILRIYQLSIHTVHKRLDLVRGVTGLNKDANNTLDMILSLIVAI